MGLNRRGNEILDSQPKNEHLILKKIMITYLTYLYFDFHTEIYIYVYTYDRCYYFAKPKIGLPWYFWRILSQVVFVII